MFVAHSQEGIACNPYVVKLTYQIVQRSVSAEVELERTNGIRTP